MSSAVHAACEVGRQYGVHAAAPVMLQETNNTVVWLRPEPVVAKVATRASSAEHLRREHAVAAELVSHGAEVAAPIEGTAPVEHGEAGCVVTLWHRLEGVARAEVPIDELAGSLGRLHDALALTEVDLPSFRGALRRARAALDDDVFMAALESPDRAFLRDAYDDGLAALDERVVDEHRLHGEPHDGNRLATADGLRWIDFENCCLGPREWDLAFQPQELDTRFAGVDTDLLELLRRLNSARVATWCWGRASYPEMRHHGALHLARLRAPRGGS